MEDEDYKEPEKCEYWGCIMCHCGCCTGDKQFAKELNLCKKKMKMIGEKKRMISKYYHPLFFFC